MAFGFKSINDFGQVIISDDIQTLHFVNKVPRDTTVPIKVLSAFPSYSGPNSSSYIDARVLITYKITTTGTPLIFIRPADYNRWASVITQSVLGTTWTFEVLMSGDSTSNIPELYCFVDANEISVGSTTYGMIVYKDEFKSKATCNDAGGFWGGDDTRDDNTCFASATTSDTTVLKIKTFDSRVRPLAVVSGGTSQPRTLPANGGNPRTTTRHRWNYANLDFDFRSNGSTPFDDGFTRNDLTTTVASTNLMYAAPSLAQAVYKRQASGFKRSCSGFSIFKKCQDHNSTATWWVMYRNAFRIQPDTDPSKSQFQSGWGTYEAGFSFISRFESGGFLGGGGGSSQFGTQPYQPKTINLTSNAFIIADSTGYQ